MFLPCVLLKIQCCGQPPHQQTRNVDLVVHVVVNHCFTSLFGTNGLLSDTVRRYKHCSQLMR